MEKLSLSITTIGDLLLRQTITNDGEPITDVNLTEYRTNCYSMVRK